MVEIDHTRSDDLRYIQQINWMVAEHLFPKRTAASMFLKLYGEIGELVDNPDDPNELADVMIMLLDHAERIDCDIGKVILKKLEVNANRKWMMDERTGVFQHVTRTAFVEPLVVHADEVVQFNGTRAWVEKRHED